MAFYALIGGAAVGLAASSSGYLLASCPGRRAWLELATCRRQIDASTDALLAPARRSCLLAAFARPGSVTMRQWMPSPETWGGRRARGFAGPVNSARGRKGSCCLMGESSGAGGDEEALLLSSTASSLRPWPCGGIAPAYPSLDLSGKTAAEMLLLCALVD